MNVYDTVNKLAEEIKASEEFINFKMAKQLVRLNTEYMKKISEFEKLRYEEQINSIQIGKSDKKQLEKIQEIYKELIEIDEIKKYFDAEFKFNVLLGDVNRTISEAIREVIS